MGADCFPGNSTASDAASSCAGSSRATTSATRTRGRDDGADQETDTRGGATETCDTVDGDGCRGGCRDGCCDGDAKEANDDTARASLESDATTCCGTEEQCDGVFSQSCPSQPLHSSRQFSDPSRSLEAVDHRHVHDDQGNHPDSACSSHLRRAFERYAAYIEQARCICRAILESGFSSTCCTKNTKKNTKNTRNTKDTSDTTNLSPTTPPPAWSRVRGKVNDPENDAGGTEAVAVFVSGMTCSGCGDKMARALRSTPGVSQVRVNFVMSNADFSVDRTITKTDHVIRAVEGATGFRCTRIAGDGDHTLDVLASGAAAAKLLRDPPTVTTGVAVVTKRVVRLTYDPAVVGARQLFDSLDGLAGGLAPPSADPALARGRERLRDQTVKTIVAAALTIPVVVLAWGDTLVDDATKAHVSLVLALFVQLIAVPEFYRPALSALVRSHVLEMDMLVVISITAAFLYSVVAYGFRMAGRPLETAAFFETSTLLITLILLGRLIATYARVKAVSAVSMRSMQTNTAVLVEDGGRDREIDARLLQYGDRFKILPHTRVPTDGVVLSGSSEFDESMLTGEPIPVAKGPQDHVIAGTVNGDGTVVAKLTRLPGKNTVTDIAALVEEAANSKPRFQDLANKVASWFVPVVTVVSLVAFVVWVVVGLEGRDWPASRSVVNALTYWVAILAVSCPCALGLAVPMVLVIAGGIAARGGVVIKSAECTERVRKCTDVIFDKTGTITEGNLDVMVEEFLTSDRDGAVAMAKSLVAGGKHPVSAALDKYLASHSVDALSGVKDVRVVAGCGVEASFDGSVLRAGHPRWTQSEHLPIVTRLRDQGLTMLVVTRDGNPLAVFGLRTLLRPEAARVIGALQARNIAVHLVSGDQTRAVQAVAASVGIPLENVAAEYSPGEKRDYVAAVMEDPKKYVLFCGDGTNDAVAVAQAHVGAQMGGALSSSDVTQGAADVVLLGGLEGIPFLLDVSRAAFNRMVFNFVWSAVYNVVAILMAAGAFVYVRIPPAYAGLGEIVSVLPVVFAALSMLLLNFRQKA
ncbi:hypothetical protein ACRALDRAFT_1049857 [Sodiomyces alcalophilus JCM 7366]|uniref:uncharacterized protein n=1 Tax=Sodiomyces alcalophilus JCM 7366 TaxID=591952 RepID=UPI0039B5AF31